MADTPTAVADPGPTRTEALAAAASGTGALPLPAAVSATPVGVNGVASQRVFPVLQSIGSAVEQFVDSAVSWLYSLHSSPLTDFVAGAVWLVRRALFIPAGATFDWVDSVTQFADGFVSLAEHTVLPAGISLGAGVGVACVATKNCSGQNLSNANLSFQNLTGVDFSGAELGYANMQGANLTNANLSRATMFGSNLINANLSGANMEWAYAGFVNGWGVNLTRVNAQYADFTAAKLRNAILVGANFTNAVFFRATCPNGDVVDDPHGIC